LQLTTKAANSISKHGHKNITAQCRASYRPSLRSDPSTFKVGPTIPLDLPFQLYSQEKTTEHQPNLLGTVVPPAT
jgi:hypothetical protein